MNVCEYEIVKFMCFLLELWFQILIKWILCTFLWDLILPDFVSTLYISKFYRLPSLLLLIMTLLIFFEKRNETNERVHSLNLKWEWELLNCIELFVGTKSRGAILLLNFRWSSTEWVNEEMRVFCGVHAHTIRFSAWQILLWNHFRMVGIHILTLPMKNGNERIKMIK